MPLLANPRYELFAQQIAAGESQKGAYIGAGFKASAHAAETKGSALVRKVEVLNRIAELRAETARGAGLSRQWIVEQAMFEVLTGRAPVPALRLLAEIEGLVGNYRVEHTGPQGGAIPLLLGVANLTTRQLGMLIEEAQREQALP